MSGGGSVADGAVRLGMEWLAAGPGRGFMKDLALRLRNGRAVPMGWSVVPTLVLAGDQ